MPEQTSRPAPPPRPPLASENTPPVLTKLTPPFSVRLTQLLWILSFAVGGFSIAYLFIIRKEQLPLIMNAMRAVDPTRNEQTYTVGADIIFWTVFAVMVGTLLVQITLLVSFNSRRSNVRWWQLLSLVGLAVVFALSVDIVAGGEQARPLRYLMVLQCTLILLALLSSVMPKAMAWSARKHDIVRRDLGGSGSLD